MNPMKIIMYSYILSIACTVAATYKILIKAILHINVDSFTICLVALCLVINIKYNPICIEMIEKIKNKYKK
ncbi:hypothetical protein AB0Y20_01040 [Heyndrickxia oleronia]